MVDGLGVSDPGVLLARSRNLNIDRGGDLSVVSVSAVPDALGLLEFVDRIRSGLRLL